MTITAQGTMNPKLCLALALVWSGGLASGHAADHPLATNIETVTANQVDKIHMLDTRNGWILRDGTNGFHLLHTDNGGQTWMDVTPHPFSHRAWDCQFPKPNMAWISFNEGKTCLLLTTNSGKSWMPWSPLGDFPNDTHNYFLAVWDCRFFNDDDGVVTTVDGGACQAAYNFFETHDGGMTWKPAPLSDNVTSSNETPGTIYTSDCDGGALAYYPPRTIVIVHGDFLDETPKGVVRLSLSTDSGKIWRDLRLPLPDKYRDGLVSCEQPVFLDDKHGWLPVRVVKEIAGEVAWNTAVWLFYATDDGGETWTRRPGVTKFSTNDVGNVWQFHVVSVKDIFVCVGANLYVTHNGAKSWHAINPNIDFGRIPFDRGIQQIDFVDTVHGWAIMHENGHQALYKTADGGKTWKKP